MGPTNSKNQNLIIHCIFWDPLVAPIYHRDRDRERQEETEIEITSNIKDRDRDSEEKMEI